MGSQRRPSTCRQQGQAARQAGRLHPGREPARATPATTRNATGACCSCSKPDNGHQASAPSFYQSWDMAGGTGGSDDDRDNIANCNTTDHGVGRHCSVHGARQQMGPTWPGHGGPHREGPERVLGRTARKPVSSQMGTSPRVVVIPLYDPVVLRRPASTTAARREPEGRQLLGFFIEGMQGNNVDRPHHAGLPASARATAARRPPARSRKRFDSCSSGRHGTTRRTSSSSHGRRLQEAARSPASRRRRARRRARRPRRHRDGSSSRTSCVVDIRGDAAVRHGGDRARCARRTPSVGDLRRSRTRPTPS